MPADTKICPICLPDNASKYTNSYCIALFFVVIHGGKPHCGRAVCALMSR